MSDDFRTLLLDASPVPTKLPRTSGVRHALVAVLGTAYALFLGFVAFWPTPVDRPVSSLLDRAIQEMHERGVPAFVDYAFIEFSANVLLFVPVGILLGLMLPVRAWPVTFLLGPALSGLIELGQMKLLEERYATLSDVLANSIGATAGVLIALVLRGLVHLRDRKVIARARAQGIVR